MSVNDNTLPPDILFKILPVVAPILAFFVFAPTAAPITGAAKFSAGFKNLFQAFSLPLNIFLSFVLYRSTFQHDIV